MVSLCVDHIVATYVYTIAGVTSVSIDSYVHPSPWRQSCVQIFPMIIFVLAYINNVHTYVKLLCMYIHVCFCGNNNNFYLTLSWFFLCFLFYLFYEIFSLILDQSGTVCKTI